MVNEPTPTNCQSACELDRTIPKGNSLIVSIHGFNCTILILQQYKKIQMGHQSNCNAHVLEVGR